MTAAGSRLGLMSSAAIVKRSVRVAGHPTSVSLEEGFWRELREIAGRDNLSIDALLTSIDAARSGNLSSAIRLFVLENCRRRPEQQEGQ